MAISTYTPPSNRIIHNTEVDFQTRTQLGMTVHLVQYDKSLPIVAVALYLNGQPYQIPTGADMNVRVGKRDGTKVYNPVLGCNTNRTICYFEVTQQMTSAYGPTLAILELIVDNAIAGSSYIPLDIAKNPAQDEAILSANEYKSMNEIIEEAREALGKPPKIQNGTWWLWDSEQKIYVDTGSPTQGETGKTGNGIASTILNDDYTLTFTFTDGTTYTTPTPIRGAIGPTGAQGPQGLTGETGATGAQGEQGETGETGNGIASTILNDDYTLTIHFTDGTRYTTPSIRGATGAQGLQGEKGETGSGFKVLGYYATESTLSAAVTNPAAGDAYGIGTGEPYDIYIWDGVNRKWVNNGALQGPAGKDGKTPVKGTDYFTDADKQELASQAAGLVDLSGKQNKIMASGILKGDGAGGVAQAVAGTDYMAPVAVAAADNGKFLRVVNGTWAAAAIDNANGVSF